MLVNGIDISTLNCKLLSKDIQPVSVVVYDDWLRKAVNPSYLGSQSTNKTIKLSILVKGATDEECHYKISSLTKQLVKCVLKFNNLPFYYDCAMISDNSAKLVEDGYYHLAVDLKSGYAYLPEETQTVSGTVDKTFTVLGDLPSPARLIITPSTNISSLTISGFGKDIVAKTLLTGVSRVIDSETGLITEDSTNRYPLTEIWEFPILYPGEKTISLNMSGVSMQIKYKPKFG